MHISPRCFLWSVWRTIVFDCFNYSNNFNSWLSMCIFISLESSYFIRISFFALILCSLYFFLNSCWCLSSPPSTLWVIGSFAFLMDLLHCYSYNKKAFFFVYLFSLKFHWKVFVAFLLNSLHWSNQQAIETQCDKNASHLISFIFSLLLLLLLNPCYKKLKSWKLFDGEN